MGSLFGTPAYEDKQMVDEFNRCETRLKIIGQKVRSIYRDFRNMNLWCKLLKDEDLYNVMSQMNDEKHQFQIKFNVMADEIRDQLNQWEDLFSRRDVFAFQLNLRFQCGGMHDKAMRSLTSLRAYVKNFMLHYAHPYEMIASTISTSPFQRLIADDIPTHWVNDQEYADDTITIDSDDDCVFLGYPDLPNRK